MENHGVIQEDSKEDKVWYKSTFTLYASIAIGILVIAVMSVFIIKKQKKKFSYNFSNPTKSEFPSNVEFNGSNNLDVNLKEKSYAINNNVNDIKELLSVLSSSESEIDFSDALRYFRTKQVNLTVNKDALLQLLESENLHYTQNKDLKILIDCATIIGELFEIFEKKTPSQVFNDFKSKRIIKQDSKVVIELINKITKDLNIDNINIESLRRS